MTPLDFVFGCVAVALVLAGWVLATNRARP
jgi:hypothetical protein